MNLCPSSIFITHRGHWKLAGFGFAEKPKEGSTQVVNVVVLLFD